MDNWTEKKALLAKVIVQSSTGRLLRLAVGSQYSIKLEPTSSVGCAFTMNTLRGVEVARLQSGERRDAYLLRERVKLVQADNNVHALHHAALRARAAPRRFALLDPSLTKTNSTSQQRQLIGNCRMVNKTTTRQPTSGRASTLLSVVVSVAPTNHDTIDQSHTHARAPSTLRASSTRGAPCTLR